MSIRINGNELDQAYLWVPKDVSLNITCLASESRPAVNVTVVINNSEEIYGLPLTYVEHVTENVPTISTSVFSSYRPDKDVVTISCNAYGVSSKVYHFNVSLYTYVFPDLYMTFNGKRVEKEHFVKAETMLNVSCHAEGAKPEAELSLYLFNKKLAAMRDSTFNEHSTIITYPLVKRLEPETITCESIQHIPNVTNPENSVTIILELSEESTRTTTPTILVPSSSSGGVFSLLQWLSSTLALLCILSFFVCGYKIIIKLRSSMSANLSTNTDSNLRAPSQIQLNSLPPTDQSLLQNTLQGSFKGKPKSDLPSIPSDESNSLNSTGSSETNYYSAAKEGTGKDRIFSENDFCLLLSIKIGTIYNRWMGTIHGKKCAVLTTASDGVIKKKIIHWDEFVKRALDLPKTNHLTKIAGIGVDKTGTLYLITEHVVCETLDSRLNFDPDSESTQSPMTVPDVMKHISGILEGMEFIKSYGFLHPGFSTKKVLYTKDGICKLYDFCLAEDAPKIVSLKKSLMVSFTLNQFPPESVFRNEYSHESDVWSTAVVIWELLSDGTSPFPVDEELTPGQDVETPKLIWPPRYLQLSNLSLFDCWHQNCSLRPSIHQLRASFKSIFETLIENSFYEIPLSSLYTPMGGGVVSSQKPDNGERASIPEGEAEM
ncbi:uncharacterized protein [Apostichopus japonicus]|uniref:uncharacterized protein isoform X2 n=1 Tax=Stichopus japonicus TaxID=307972 RepID=UPI003AB5A96B